MEPRQCYPPVLSHQVLNSSDICPVASRFALGCAVEVDNLGAAALELVDPMVDARITQSLRRETLMKRCFDLCKVPIHFHTEPDAHPLGELQSQSGTVLHVGKVSSSESVD